jgi:antitoxin VapB
MRVEPTAVSSRDVVVYTNGIYLERMMTTTAKLFKNGRSQAVRLPREFRFEGDRVRVRRAGRGVLVEPMFTDVSAWFAELDRLAAEPFIPEGRQQPPAPQRIVFDDDVPA